MIDRDALKNRAGRLAFGCLWPSGEPRRPIMETFDYQGRYHPEVVRWCREAGGVWLAEQNAWRLPLDAQEGLRLLCVRIWGLHGTLPYTYVGKCPHCKSTQWIEEPDRSLWCYGCGLVLTPGTCESCGMELPEHSARCRPLPILAPKPEKKRRRLR